MKTTTFTLIAILFTFNLFAAPISVQGVLRDSDNRAIADGTYAMDFQVFESSTASTSSYASISKSVVVTNGVYSEVLEIPNNANASTSELWLEITVGTEIMPRVRLYLSPYEFLDLTTGGNNIADNGDVTINASLTANNITSTNNVYASGVNVKSIHIQPDPHVYDDVYRTAIYFDNEHADGSGSDDVAIGIVKSNGGNTVKFGFYSKTSENNQMYFGENSDVVSIIAQDIVYFNASQVMANSATILTSDARLKHDIHHLEEALSVIRQLEPLRYQKRRDLPKSGYNSGLAQDLGEESGFIAQDIQRIPELEYLITGGGDRTDHNGNVVEQPLGVKYNDIFVYNVAATKELDKKNTILENKVKSLERTIATLTSDRLIASNRMTDLENKIDILLSDKDNSKDSSNGLGYLDNK